jgi:hypothetical protein
MQKVVLCECDEDGFSASSSKSSSHSHSNIASESEGVSLVDTVINYDYSVDGDKDDDDDDDNDDSVLSQVFIWQCLNNYSEDRAVFCDDCACRNYAEDVADTLDYIHLGFLTKA